MNKHMPDCWWTLALKWSPDRGIYDLHGLWPEAPLEQWVQEHGTAQSPVLDKSALRDILGELESCWNSDMHAPIRNGMSKEQVEKIIMNADYKFWDHEWKRHGCKSGMPEHEYFACALDEYKKRKDMMPPTNEHHQIHFYLDRDRNTISTDLHPREYKH